MATFQFELQPLLEHRQRIEDEKQKTLAQQLRLREALERQLRELQETVVSDKHTMKQQLIGKVDVSRIRQHALHGHQVSIRAQQLLMRLAQLMQQIDAARAELIEASRERKAVEKLREKRYQAWQREQNKREARQLDEIAVQQYTRLRRLAV